MKAYVSQCCQVGLDADDPVTIPDEGWSFSLSVLSGQYMIFAKVDVELSNPDNVTGDSAGFNLELLVGGVLRDRSFHAWHKGVHTPHRKETVALNSFALFEKGSEVVEIILRVTGSEGDIFAASNVTISAIEVDQVNPPV